MIFASRDPPYSDDPYLAFNFRIRQIIASMRPRSRTPLQSKPFVLGSHLLFISPNHSNLRLLWLNCVFNSRELQPPSATFAHFFSHFCPRLPYKPTLSSTPIFSLLNLQNVPRRCFHGNSRLPYRFARRPFPELQR